MANIQVSGAGTSAVNGDYTEAGTYGGKPYYELAGGGWYLVWYSGVHWGIVNSLAPSWEGYYLPGGGDLPGTGWAIASYLADSPPTVTAIGSGHAISGTVDDGTDPLAGVTVDLSGNATDSTATGEDGTFSFGELTDGSYALAFSKAHYAFNPASIADLEVDGADVTGQDATGTLLHGISGTVLDANADPVEGLPIKATAVDGTHAPLTGYDEASATTGSDGAYSLEDLLPLTSPNSWDVHRGD